MKIKEKTLEETKEFKAGIIAGKNARLLTNDLEQAWYKIEIPEYILENPNYDIHIAFGMGVPIGFDGHY